MRLGVYQFSVSGNIQDNLAKIRDAACRSAESGVRLLVFPECALTGYPPRNIPASENIDFWLLDDAHNELQTLADRFGLYLIVGTMTKAENSIFNTALCFCPGRQAIAYHKRALWGWDRDNFVPGNEPGILEIDGLKIGVRICFEVRFPEYFRELYRQKTDLNVILFYDVADRDDESRYDLIRGHIRTRAVENVCPILTADATHPFQTAPTMLTDASGNVLAEMERGREGLMIFDYEPAQPNFGERGRIEISDRLITENTASTEYKQLSEYGKG